MNATMRRAMRRAMQVFRPATRVGRAGGPARRYSARGPQVYGAERAKQLAVSSVNQRMGGENFCKSWKRPSRSKEETKTRERISLVAKFSFQLTDCAKGEPSRPRSDSRDESAGFLSRQLFCCVVWLAKFIRKVLDGMKALAHQHDWRAFRHCEGYQRGPAGVNAKTDRGMFHVFLDFSFLCVMSGARSARWRGLRRCRRRGRAQRCRVSDCGAAIRRAASQGRGRLTLRWDGQARLRLHSHLLFLD